MDIFFTKKTSNIYCLYYIDSWFDHAMDTVQVIEELELKENYNKIIGVGHSFGGSSM